MASGCVPVDPPLGLVPGTGSSPGSCWGSVVEAGAPCSQCSISPSLAQGLRVCSQRHRQLFLSFPPTLLISAQAWRLGLCPKDFPFAQCAGPTLGRWTQDPGLFSSQSHSTVVFLQFRLEEKTLAPIFELLKLGPVYVNHPRALALDWLLASLESLPLCGGTQGKHT